MTEGNQQDPPPEAPERKPGTLPLPGQRILDPKDIKANFQPSGLPQPAESGGAGEKRVSSLPDAPKAVWRREVKRSGPEQIPEAPNIREMPEDPYKDYFSGQQWEDSSRKGARGLSPAVEERRRQRMAALFGVTQGIERLPDSNQIAFSCPVCHERIQCDDTELGKERVCSTCRSEYKLPEEEHEGQVTLLRLDPLRGQAEDLPAALLPEERGADGRSNEAVFLPVEELTVDGQEVVVEWGLEKFETKPEPAKFRWLWAMVAMLVFGSAAGFLLVHVQKSSGRTNSGAAPSGADAPPKNDAPGRLDWSKLTPGQVFLMADATVRAYFSAPDVAAKAAVSRGGGGTLPRMRAYYEAKGGYESETRRHGEVRNIQIIEERVVGGQKFLMARVRFERGTTGILALLKGKDRIEVDWDYAVAYGEIEFVKLLFERPTEPVLLRAHVRETSEFHDGFTSTGFRSFDMRDPTRTISVPAYVAIGSAADAKLREAWEEGGAISHRGGQITAQPLHFTLKLRYDDSEGRRGFLIDKILTQGWILPDEAP